MSKAFKCQVDHHQHCRVLEPVIVLEGYSPLLEELWAYAGNGKETELGQAIATVAKISPSGPSLRRA